MFRILDKQLTSSICKTKKVVVLLGARQVGKTTLLKKAFPGAIYINLERSNYIDIFNHRDLDKIMNLIATESAGKSDILVLDEIQRLDDPGLVAKLIHDELKDVKLVISGSSALEIANKASESLAGRKVTFKMYPLTFSEFLTQSDKKSRPKVLSQISFSNQVSSKNYRSEILRSMRYGLYPDILNVEDVEQYLLELVDSIIFKDVYYLNLVKNTKNLYSLLKLVAYQIGQQINVTDLSNRVGIARATVLDYLEILQKTYIIYTLSPFTKKRRDEIGKTEKIYFYDLGVRNAIINDFSPVEYRRDYGSIFENFVISELIKLNSYYNLRYSFYYWRTKWGSEVDLILEKDSQISAFEIKTRKGSVSSAFINTYPSAQTFTLTLDNFTQLL